MSKKRQSRPQFSVDDYIARISRLKSAGRVDLPDSTVHMAFMYPSNAGPTVIKTVLKYTGSIFLSAADAEIRAPYGSEVTDLPEHHLVNNMRNSPGYLIQSTDRKFGIDTEVRDWAPIEFEGKSLIYGVQNPRSNIQTVNIATKAGDITDLLNNLPIGGSAQFRDARVSIYFSVPNDEFVANSESAKYSGTITVDRKEPFYLRNISADGRPVQVEYFQVKSQDQKFGLDAFIPSLEWHQYELYAGEGTVANATLIYAPNRILIYPRS